MSRVVAEISNNKVLQVEKTPDEGEPHLFNGRYAVPVPPGASVDVDADTVIVPQGGPNDLAAQMAAALLAQYPMYENIAYNFLLEASDVDGLDLAATPGVSAVGPWPPLTRAQTGRNSGPNVGMVPNMTALLPMNTRTSPFRPGMLITDTIDIGPVTAGAGADEFLIWWHIYEYQTGEDVASDFGIFAGNNSPAIREIKETDQESGAWSVYLSNDDGVTWTQVGRLEPTDLFVFDTTVRLAFVSGNTSGKVYLAAYAVMF